jgi:hypothetical protein
VSAPIVSHRPTRFGWLARLVVGLVAAGGLLAVVATARAMRVEPAVTMPEPVVEAREEVRADPAWTISSEPVERTGFRHGRRHTIAVVPLGPSAVEVEVRTARAFLAMRAAAADAGIELRLESGFRTAAQQRVLYQAWRNGRGNKAARPGLSNHQSGRAVDIAVARVPGALAWLEDNAMSYGFKRTVKSEPWHWEYVDVPIARSTTKRVRGKTGKHAKAVAHTTRPARRPSSAATTSRKAGPRVASSRR